MQFQSTLLQEERPITRRILFIFLEFQSTLLQEERQCKNSTFARKIKFQSTLLQEERRVQFAKVGSGSYFNPRSYKRSDIETATPDELERIFQSTLLQEERLTDFFYFVNFVIISIHAPTRGATSLNSVIDNISIISIHAPTRGATTFYFLKLNLWLFQSTLLQEERRCFFS